jgi:hypothetical protein
VTAATDKIGTETSAALGRFHETSVRARPWALALGVSLYAGVACALTLAGGSLNDWRFFHTAGAAVWDAAWSGNPYAAVAAMGEDPFYYPGPAALVLAPFGLLPVELGFLAWATMSGYLFGLAAQRHGRGLLPACFSASFLQGIAFGQWAPLLVAGAVLPGLGWVLAAKPSIGLALVFAMREYRPAIIGSILLTVASLVVLPSWPLDWWASLQATNHVAPVARPFGWILLLAALRWRTPEARLLLALAVIPHTTSLVETLPLFLLCRDRWEGYGLVGLSYAVAVGQQWVAPEGSMAVEPLLAARWPVLLMGMYLPALGLVLSRPRGATSGRGYWSRGWGTTRRAAPVAP